MSDLSSITENTQKNLDQDARLDAAEAKNLEQDGRLDATEAVANASTQKNIEQDNRLDATETVANAAEIKNTEQDTRLDANDQKNLEQDNRLTDTEAVADAAALKNLEQDGRLDANDTKNTEQDTRLTDIETDIQNIETKNTQQDTRLDNIETKNTEQDGRLTDTEAVANAAQTVADAAALKNNEQDGRLDLIEDKNTEQDTRLTDTETVADAAIPLAQKGVINGVAQLDGTGKIPINQIPSLAKSSKVVADITARDAILEEDRFEGLRVHVLDASADPSVTTGSAGYILKSGLTNLDWEKAYESESLDLDLDASIDNHLNTSSASANQILSWTGTDYAWVEDQIGGGGTSYTDASVDAHLNTSTATNGQILSWTGTDYAWVEDQTGGSGGSGGLELATLSSGPITADISTHYLVDTTADAITVNLPNGNALTPTEQTIATIRFTDSTKQFSTNNLILVPATGEQINGFSIDESLFVDVTGAWVQVSWDSANSLWALNTSGGGGGPAKKTQTWIYSSGASKAFYNLVVGQWYEVDFFLNLAAPDTGLDVRFIDWEPTQTNYYFTQGDNVSKSLAGVFKFKHKGNGDPIFEVDGDFVSVQTNGLRITLTEIDNLDDSGTPFDL